ncbi:MAG: RNA methyltransferase [Frankiales bacterium]|nr:RNA methyltransferase [Frankiales bacterium]
MAYDERLAERIRGAAPDGELTERRMFGGLCFLLDGHMLCGVVSDDLMLRLGPEAAEHALERPHVRPMDFTGRPSRGMVYVAPAGLRGRALGAWLVKAEAFVRTLPPRR